MWQGSSARDMHTFRSVRWYEWTDTFLFHLLSMAHTHTFTHIPHCLPPIFKSPFWFVDFSKTARSRIIDTTPIWPPVLVYFCLWLPHAIEDNTTKATIHIVSRDFIKQNEITAFHFRHWQKRFAAIRTVTGMNTKNKLLWNYDEWR